MNTINTIWAFLCEMWLRFWMKNSVFMGKVQKVCLPFLVIFFVIKLIGLVFHVVWAMLISSFWVIPIVLVTIIVMTQFSVEDRTALLKKIQKWAIATYFPSWGRKIN